MMRPMRATTAPCTLCPTLCWQNEGQLWFQFSDALPDSIKAHRTVIRIVNVHTSVDGVHLLERVNWEQGACFGPTLLMIQATVDCNSQIVYHKDSAKANGASAALEVICEVGENSVAYLECLEAPPLQPPEDAVRRLEALHIIEEEVEEIDSEYASSESDGCFVPFDTESYGLSDPSAPQEIINAAICSLKLEAQKAIHYVCHLLRFIVHQDPNGIHTSSILSRHILDGIQTALMQRGDGLCVVLQRMVPSIAAATLAAPTSKAFQGGVLMQLLYIMEDIYRTKQVNVRTTMVEEAPDNLFEHMDGRGLTTAVLGECGRQ